MTREEIFETQKSIILNLIPKEKESAITLTNLVGYTGLKARTVKYIITSLRIEYPVCSQDINGGGYWIAESDQDIKDFLSMMITRRDSYNKSISIMQSHIGEKS